MVEKDGEPSVEEILRSIKQVIARDDDPKGGEGASPGGTPEGMAGRAAPDFGVRQFGRRTAFPGDPPAPANSEPEAEADQADDVYDLGALPQEDIADEHDTAGPAAPEPAAPAPSAASATPADDGLIAAPAAASVRDQLARLDALAGAEPAAATASANPLEDLVREMLRPLLKDWLDANLESVIERMVEREIARITGRR